MTSRGEFRTLQSVDMTGTRAKRAVRPVSPGAALFALACCVAFAGRAAPASADTQVFDGTVAPIVRINVREGPIVVRTWDREAVSVEGDPTLDIRRSTTEESGESVPMAIPQLAAPNADANLPPESFVTATIPSGTRAVVIVKSLPNTPRAPVTVFVPNDTAFVYAHAANGTLEVSDYRGGTLVALTRNGRLLLNNVGGTVFAQSLHGPIVARNSTFDRVRARSLFGNVTFERCNVRQIEATTVTGSIVYDGGSFEPGLARFESTAGNVAVGASGNVQYGAHASGEGRVYTNFVGRAQIDAREGSTSAVVGEGGPVVTATSQDGSVFLYDGSLRGRAQLPPEWQPAVDTLQRPGVRAPAPRPAHFVPSPGFRRFPPFKRPHAGI
jgi:hypothetical protein